jgi:hypothetical protein
LTAALPVKGNIMNASKIIPKNKKFDFISLIMRLLKKTLRHHYILTYYLCQTLYAHYTKPFRFQPLLFSRQRLVSSLTLPGQVIPFAATINKRLIDKNLSVFCHVFNRPSAP